MSAGFWINSLYSPWRKWRDLARKFLADQKSPETLREFVNTVLAEPWDDEAQTTKPTFTAYSVTDYTAGTEEKSKWREVGAAFAHQDGEGFDSF